MWGGGNWKCKIKKGLNEIELKEWKGGEKRELRIRRQTAQEEKGGTGNSIAYVHLGNVLNGSQLTIFRRFRHEIQDVDLVSSREMAPESQFGLQNSEANHANGMGQQMIIELDEGHRLRECAVRTLFYASVSGWIRLHQLTVTSWQRLLYFTLLGSVYFSLL